jgi:hypothetical protein
MAPTARELREDGRSRIAEDARIATIIAAMANRITSDDMA